MIKKIRNIDSVDYKLDNSFYIKTNNVYNESGIFKDNIVPLEFNYNSKWEIKHKCLCCNKHITVSQDPLHNYIGITGLLTRLYRVEFLNMISSLFMNLKVLKLKTSGYEYLTYLNFNNENCSPFDVPLVELLYYKCNSCNAEYLSVFRNSYPLFPDKIYNEGIVGKVIVDEIIQIEVETDKSFKDLLNIYKNNS